MTEPKIENLRVSFSSMFSQYATETGSFALGLNQDNQYLSS